MKKNPSHPKESPKSPEDTDSQFLSHHPIYPPGLPTLGEILESRLKSKPLPEPTTTPTSTTEKPESQASPNDSLAEQSRKADLYFQAQEIPKADIPTSRQQRIEFLQNDKRQAIRELREIRKLREADNS